MKEKKLEKLQKKLRNNFIKKGIDKKLNTITKVLNLLRDNKLLKNQFYKINVKKGQKVKRGDVIGKSGNSGRAAGFHLHYEVHKNKKVDDPKKYFFLGYIK